MTYFDIYIELMPIYCLCILRFIYIFSFRKLINPVVQDINSADLFNLKKSQ